MNENLTTECKSLSATEVNPLTLYTAVHFVAGYVLMKFMYDGKTNNHVVAFKLILLHLLFEQWESTACGIAFFNNRIFSAIRSYLRRKTGWDLWCEYVGDSWSNSLLDTLAFALGVFIAAYPRNNSQFK